MNKRRKSARPMLVMLAVAAVATQFGASAAEAGNKGQRQTSQRPSGSYSQQTQVQRTASGHTRSDTWTSADGRIASRNATVVNDKAAGTRTRDVQRQGPEGQTTTRNTTAVYDANTKTWTKDVSVNRGDGG
jgi:hypothetical protein